MTDYELRVVEAMQKYGGSFVKALAMAFYMADNKNFYKLKSAFPEYWKEYTEWAKRDANTNEQN